MARPLPEAKDALAGGTAAIFNAENLIESAEIVAERGNFGAAIALAVLGVEEAVKARVLFGVLTATKFGAPFGLKDKAFRDTLFHNHALRHVLAFLQEMSNETRTALVIGVEPRDEQGREAVKRDLELVTWLAKANRAKLRGLYTDFKGGRWLEPKDVTPDEWQVARSISRSFIGETRRQQGAAKGL